MNLVIEKEVKRLINEKRVVDVSYALHILNGQVLYDIFQKECLLKDSDIVPFNEAMCVNHTTELIFDSDFIKVRAKGHKSTVADYKKMVINPLSPLLEREYDLIYLWFGEDMFCQMNVLAILAYLEQSGFNGQVLLNSFDNSEFLIKQIKIALGSYDTLYKKVLVKHEPTTVKSYSLLDRAIAMYLELLNKENRVTQYISKKKDISLNKLLQKLFKEFDYIGYGDVQYLELINKTKENSS